MTVTFRARHLSVSVVVRVDVPTCTSEVSYRKMLQVSTNEDTSARSSVAEIRVVILSFAHLLVYKSCRYFSYVVLSSLPRDNCSLAILPTRIHASRCALHRTIKQTQKTAKQRNENGCPRPVGQKNCSNTQIASFALHCTYRGLHSFREPSNFDRKACEVFPEQLRLELCESGFCSQENTGRQTRQAKERSQDETQDRRMEPRKEHR